MAGKAGMRDKLLKSPQRAEQWRAGVRIGLIRNRLTQHFLGKLELTPTQLKAAEILLSKTLPSVAHVEHSGELNHNFVSRMPAPAENAEQWQAQHSPTPILQTLQ